jgi:GNAT superfamily N-acetyltransferase
VAKTAHWEDVGRALLREALRIAKERGAAQAVVVCGHLDEPKRAFLRSEDLNIASE